MIKHESGLPVGFRRPAKLIKKRNNLITSPPDLSTMGEKVAYLSVPSSWSEEIHKQVLQSVRTDLPDLRVESFMTAFTLSELLEEPPVWRELIQNFITDSSTLIVACDNTRIVGVGIRREIQMASRGRKRIILFDVTEGRCRRFFGYDYVKDGSIELRRGLRTKAEREEMDRRLKKRLRKREKYQRRLAEQSIAVESGRGDNVHAG